MSTLEVWVLPAARARAGLERLLGGATIQHSETGKPWVAGGPHFNLSHSRDLALIAVCPDAPVGVDLEAPRALRNPTGLARRICSPREREFLAASADPTAALLRLWVRKEAVAKAEGGGLATAVSGIDVLGPQVSVGSLRFLVHDLAPPADGYLAAVAWADR